MATEHGSSSPSSSSHSFGPFAHPGLAPDQAEAAKATFCTYMEQMDSFFEEERLHLSSAKQDGVGILGEGELEELLVSCQRVWL